MNAPTLNLTTLRQHAVTLLKSLLLPLLVAAYPVLYVYSSNADQLETINLRMPLNSALIAAAAAFLVFLAVQRRPITASLSAAVFAGLFHGYGYIYRWLVEPDTVQIEHFWLLPVVLTLAIYAGVLISRLRREPARALQMVLLVAAAALVTYNVVISSRSEFAASAVSGANGSASHTPVPGAAAEEGRAYPDIYYIVFDEYAGFNVLREYFKDNSVDEFEAYLEENGFYLASRSRSETLSTLVEITSRLDLTRYNEDMDDKVIVSALRDNEVMAVLKSYGYTTVAIDMAFQGIHADRSMYFDANQLGGMAVDEFQRKFIRDTMLLPFERYLLDAFPSGEKQAAMIFDSLEMTAGLEDIEGPKFVFTHILLPHMPFIFDAQGNLLDPAYREDWNYYLGQYQYSSKVAMDLLTTLLEQADPDNPPVIIFQSDHGARNISARTKDKERLFLNRRLENYSLSKYAYNIINALYLPGYDTSTLRGDMAPIDTFALVLNHYLGAGVEVKEPEPEAAAQK